MKRGWTAVLAAVVAGSLAVGLAAGAVPLAPGVVWRGLLGTDPAAATIVRELRAPRVLLAFLVGGSLAVSGAALQVSVDLAPGAAAAEVPIMEWAIASKVVAMQGGTLRLSGSTRAPVGCVLELPLAR